MASTIQIKIGALTAVAAPLGAATDAVIGVKIKEWAVGVGIAGAGDANQVVADKVTEWLRDRFREHVRAWHIARERTTFEQTSQAAGETFLDT